ncbi:MAG: hypothetical protein HZB51_08905 [Chloroflexi bacterium]|nr:hypothetical protein [Chloroflexota bacterium]
MTNPAVPTLARGSPRYRTPLDTSHVVQGVFFLQLERPMMDKRKGMLKQF